MRKHLICLIGVLLINVKLHSQTRTFFVPADSKPIKFEIQYPEKKFYEQVWFTVTVGALIGFLSSLGLTSYNLRKSKINELRDSRAEVAALNTKLRTTANEIFNLNFEHYYYKRQSDSEYMNAAREIAQATEKKSNDSLTQMREKKNTYDYLIADVMKHVQKFSYYMSSVQRQLIRELLIHIIQINFDQYKYINSREEKSKNISLHKYLALQKEIDGTLVHDLIINKFTVPVEGILRDVLRTYANKSWFNQIQFWKKFSQKNS